MYFTQEDKNKHLDYLVAMTKNGYMDTEMALMKAEEESLVRRDKPEDREQGIQNR
jgi:hypothetical protein